MIIKHFILLFIIVCTIFISTGCDLIESSKKTNEQLFEEGLIANTENKKEKAFKSFRKAAEQGYAPAQYEVGDCYRYGNGVEINKEEAIKWWTKAAEQGHKEAEKKLKELDH